MGTFANAATANDFMTGRKPLPTPAGGEIVSARFTIALGTGDLDANDIGAFGKLPAGCVPVDVFIDGTDMDTGAGGATMVFTVGIMNAAGDSALSTDAADGGGAWGASTATKTAFNQRATFTLNNINAVEAASEDRLIGAIVTAAPETAAAGTLGVTVFYKSA